MVERDWKNQGHYEKQDEYVVIIRADDQQEEETNQQDHDLGSHDVGENSSHEKALLAFEKGHAVRTVVPDVKWLGHDPRLATRRTT